MGVLESLQKWFAAVIDPLRNADKPLPQLPETEKQSTSPLSSLTQQQEEDLDALIHEFPDVSPDDVKGLLLAGFTLDEIRAILKAGFTQTQIQDILTRIKAAQRDQHGTDRLGLTTDQIRDLVNRVAAAVNSPDEDIQLEGEVARVLISDLVAFRRKIIDPATGKVIGDIDVETPEAIIEVTKESRNKLPQVLKEKNNTMMNPKGKRVILYAPDYSHASDVRFQSYGIPIIRTFEGLFDYRRSL
jgi:hypothetical protein